MQCTRISSLPGASGFWLRRVPEAIRRWRSAANDLYIKSNKIEVVGANPGHWTKVGLRRARSRRRIHDSNMAAATSVVVLDRGNNTTCTINLHGVCARADYWKRSDLRIGHQIFSPVPWNTVQTRTNLVILHGQFLLRKSCIPTSSVIVEKKAKEKTVDWQQGSNGYVVTDWQSAAPRSGSCVRSRSRRRSVCAPLLKPNL